MSFASTRDEIFVDKIASHSFKEIVRRSLISGIAIAIPLIVTLVVVGFALNFISNTLNPVVFVVKNVPGVSMGTHILLVKIISVGFIGISLFVVGFAAEYRSGSGRVGTHFNDFMASLPGLGSVYTSFTEMSELLLDSDSESFKEVKLVEYPTEGSYAVAFKTAETTNNVKRTTGHEAMESLFLPMAPNPVMGGFVIHVAQDRVIDVDMTVEEGIRSIVTSGVASGDRRRHSLSPEQLRELGQNVSNEAVESSPVMDIDESTRIAQYEAALSPEQIETPTGLSDHFAYTKSD